MNIAIAIFLSMLQSLDVTWRVFVTFLTAVIVVCLTLFVFLPLFLALLKLLLRFLQKTLLGATNFCMNLGKACESVPEKRPAGFLSFWSPPKILPFES